MTSKRDSEIRDVICHICDTINPVWIGMSGAQTIICKGCGAKIKLTSDITLVGLELKRYPREEAYMSAHACS